MSEGPTEVSSEGPTEVSLRTLMAPAFKVACSEVVNKSQDGGRYGLEPNMMGTEVVVSGPDTAGLLACITGQLYLQGYDIHSTKGESIILRPGQLTTEVRDTFVVTRFGMAIEAEEEAQLCKTLARVADELHKTASKKVETIVQYSITVDNDEVAGASVLYVQGPDASGLLGAITGCLSASSCTIVSFGGETLPQGGVRDRFVISISGAQLTEGQSAPLVRRLQEACRKVAMPEEEEMTNRFDVQVESGLTDTCVVVDGPDTPGLLSKLSAALASDGYEVVGFEAASGHDNDAEGVHDIFRVTRDNKPLSDEEGAALKAWITQVCDRAYHDSLKLHRSHGMSTKDSLTSKMNSKESNTLASPKRMSMHSSGMRDLKDARGALSKSKRGGFHMGLLLGCARRNPGSRYDERDGMSSKSSSGDPTLDGMKRSMTKYEREGLIAALKNKGEALAAAADVLMHQQSVTDDEFEMLQQELGEKHLSDLMKRAQIDPSEVICGEVIGTGVFGEVRTGSLHGTPIAIKTMHRKGISTGGLELFKAECELGLTLRHPNIVQLIGACWAMDAPTVFLVMERCQCTLSDALRETKAGRRDDFALEVRLPCAVGIARAMAYLHTQKPPILHRDLKPDNILISGDYQAKVSDFGSSRDVAKMAMTQVGTPLFSAPELMAHEPYDGSVDVWSFGCVLSCIYYWCAPRTGSC